MNLVMNEKFPFVPQNQVKILVYEREHKIYGALKLSTFLARLQRQHSAWFARFRLESPDSWNFAAVPFALCRFRTPQNIIPPR